MGKLRVGVAQNRRTRLGLRSFAPTNIAGCKLWLDAADRSTITVSGGATDTSLWKDKSGGGFDVGQGTVGARPQTDTVTINGMNVLRFDGGDYLEFVGSTGVNVDTATVFAVYRENTTVAFCGVVSYHDNAVGVNDWNDVRGFSLNTANATNYSEIDRNGAGGVIAGSGTTPFDVWAARLFTGSGGAENAYRGTTATTGTGASAAGTYNVARGGIVIGGRWLTGAVDAAVRLNGDIAEIVVYDTTLSDANLNIVGKHLSNKWGLAWAGL